MLKVKSYFLVIWSIVDPIYYSFTRLVYVEQVFRVRLMRYRGSTLLLSDGTKINTNDILLKIHLHNIYLVKSLMSISNGVVKGRKIHRLVQQSMPGLVRYIMNHPEYDKIKGVIGITTLTRGIHELGFETFPIDNNVYKMYKWITLFPIFILTVVNPLKKVHKHVPSYLLMSKPKLFNKYSA